MDTRHFSPGEVLRRARLERGISLGDVETALKVRLRYLQALETDDYTSLPPSAYTRGLVQQYARFLGLDPARFVDAAIPMRPEERNPIRPAVPPLERPPFVSLKAVSTVAVMLMCAGMLLYLYVQYNSFAQSVDFQSAPSAVAQTQPTPSNRIV
ncbi:MAG: hypothetical protein QOF51_3554, partial [Chloroflexota bacterium]|nr:hypothetical protein [Chloroflexota bacterium]